MNKTKIENIIEFEIATNYDTPSEKWQFIRGVLKTAFELDAITFKEYTFLYFAYRKLLLD